MNAITLRNLSDDASRALEARAEQNGTTAEVEAERMLEDALAIVSPKAADASGLQLVEALQQLGRDFPEFLELDFSRDQTPARAASFE
ncbi:plasmid stability protein [Neorhizobium huautlense]|uniref:Plasmid stability protein n=1 Tax=Neorhizobium huautlense TaxID=67774 RepID=A0ABT9PX62_9HYPH|nr:hypothetical protein [Neorhizobium huautlense]MDP9839066.1 plasmid stability protein [Neorhizobium huautlense]